MARWPAHVSFRRNADAEPFHDPAPVRIDAGFGEGDEISPYYDSMIGKLIVHKATRQEAIITLRRALSEFVVEGIKTTIPLLKKIIEHPTFQDGTGDTKFVERTW